MEPVGQVCESDKVFQEADKLSLCVGLNISLCVWRSAVNWLHPPDMSLFRRQ